MKLGIWCSAIGLVMWAVLMSVANVATHSDQFGLATLCVGFSGVFVAVAMVGIAFIIANRDNSSISPRRRKVGKHLWYTSPTTTWPKGKFEWE